MGKGATLRRALGKWCRMLLSLGIRCKSRGGGNHTLAPWANPARPSMSEGHWGPGKIWTSKTLPCCSPPGAGSTLRPGPIEPHRQQCASTLASPAPLLLCSLSPPPTPVPGPSLRCPANDRGFMPVAPPTAPVALDRVRAPTPSHPSDPPCMGEGGCGGRGQGHTAQVLMAEGGKGLLLQPDSITWACHRRH